MGLVGSNANRSLGFPDTYGAIRNGQWGRLIPWSAWYYDHQAMQQAWMAYQNNPLLNSEEKYGYFILTNLPYGRVPMELAGCMPGPRYTVTIGGNLSRRQGIRSGESMSAWMSAPRTWARTRHRGTRAGGGGPGGSTARSTRRRAGAPDLKPGPYAGKSIPARSPAQKFTPAERAAINEIGETSGCHSCGTTNPGTKSGNFVPDHQPPSALNTTGAPQQLYPQCIDCSRQQGLAIAQWLRGQ